jgi:hypothetical protein
MNPNSPPPPDTPKGLLFLLDPAYSDLIPEEYEFSERMRQAWEEGALFLPQTESVPWEVNVVVSKQ